MVEAMNQNITYESKYTSLPILKIPGGLHVDYLDRSYAVIEYVIRRYTKVLALRVDLRLPEDYNQFDTNVITRFFSSLKAKLKADYEKKKSRNPTYVHTTELYYVWAREVGNSGKPHYHVCIFLNGQAYSTLGKYEDKCNNLFSKVRAAWVSALGTHYSDNPATYDLNLARFPENCRYFLERNKPGFDTKLRALNKRISYLAKVDSKPRGDGINSFGSSRVPKPVFGVGG